MNSKKFGSRANHKQAPWKEPLPDFIGALYWNRFKGIRTFSLYSLFYEIHKHLFN